MLPIKARSEKFGDVSIKFEKDFKIFDGIKELEYFDNIVQKWKEFTVLMKFINASDKNGLKINVEESIRRIIDFDSFKLFLIIGQMNDCGEILHWLNIMVLQPDF